MSQLDKKLALYLQRCKAKVDAGAHYEAQQSVRTYANRYVAAKKYDDAAELLLESCKMLINADKFDEAADLLLYLVEIFVKQSPSEDQFQKEQLPKVVEVFSEFPDTDANVPNLAKELFKWASEASGSSLGDAQLNYVLGEKLFYSEAKENMHLAEQYLLLSRKDEAFNLLLDLNTQVLSVDTVGKIAPRLVVSYLLLRNVKFAKKALAAVVANFANQGESVDGQVVFSDDRLKMLNFLQLLVQLVQHASSSNADAFKILFGRYRPLFDATLEKKVNSIGETYFGVSVVQAAVNPLQNIMSGLFGK